MSRYLFNSGDGERLCAASLMLPTIDRLRLGEETQQDVMDDGVVLLLQGGMGDARHDSELLVRIRQLLEELHQVGEARDAVVLAAHDDGRGLDVLGIAD